MIVSNLDLDLDQGPAFGWGLCNGLQFPPIHMHIQQDGIPEFFSCEPGPDLLHRIAEALINPQSIRSNTIIGRLVGVPVCYAGGPGYIPKAARARVGLRRIIGSFQMSKSNSCYAGPMAFIYLGPTPFMMIISLLKGAASSQRFSKASSCWHTSFKYGGSRAAHITVSPPICLVDNSVNVTITGLDSNKLFTLQTSLTDHKGVSFASVAHYRSDENGTVDLDKSASLGGHFAGVHPMAPFVHLFPKNASKMKYARVSLHDVESPFEYKFDVYKKAIGYPLMAMGAETLGVKPVCSATQTRHFMGEGCTRMHVRHGRVRGVLHLPPGDGPFPGVVDLSGSSGGVREQRAALLAARGCAVLCLAYFAYEDLPPDLTHQLDTAYFQEAVDYLLAHDKVTKTGVGMFGFSKGGDVALSAASDIPQVKVVVTANGAAGPIFGPMKFKDGTVVKCLPFDESRCLVLPNNVVDITHLTLNPLDNPESFIPVEKIKNHVLWFSSLEDKNFNNEMHLQAVKQRLKEKNPEALANNWEFMEEQGAGHIIEPPYLPFTEASFHPLVQSIVTWGGNALQHNQAEVRLWHRMIQLFKEKLA
ncbi:Acyl-CoA thioester hydrolase/bile acid-CoA amino acid N-acetyltransferase [Trinorchestia longiramus]|nr:Acyl-CoA thioester hydrolase/bile acid-CoA amino acid N-acetyltransferase [Trinorchestia longiramus]